MSNPELDKIVETYQQRRAEMLKEKIQETVQRERERERESERDMARVKSSWHTTNIADTNTASAAYIGDNPMANAVFEEMPPNIEIGTARRTPLMRRRDIGDACRIIDTPGYYVHIQSNPKGEVVRSSLIEIDAEMKQFTYCGENGDNAWRSIERLPRDGVLIFLW
jgi:hypothetical protein